MNRRCTDLPAPWMPADEREYRALEAFLLPAVMSNPMARAALKAARLSRTQRMEAHP